MSVRTSGASWPRKSNPVRKFRLGFVSFVPYRSSPRLVGFVWLASSGWLRLDSSVFIGSSVWYGRPFACYVGRHPIFVRLLVVSIAHWPCRFFVPLGELIGWITF